MTENETPPPCCACFSPCARIAQEAFAREREVEAFGRLSGLLAEGKSPALCRKDDGTLYVCHCEPALCRQPAQGKCGASQPEGAEDE